MKQLQLNLAWNIKHVLILYSVIGIIKGHPINRKNIDNLDQQAEKTYPNGTVVGKYFYKDSEGNPIHVKYYADDSGYGVELKSIKVVSMSTSEQNTASEQPKSNKLILKTNEEVDTTTTTFNPIYDYKSTSNPFEDLKNYRNGKTKYTSSPDYEIFVDNELKTPKKCGQDKVHVYFENNKRKARQTFNEFDALKYCEQFQIP